MQGSSAIVPNPLHTPNTRNHKRCFQQLETFINLSGLCDCVTLLPKCACLIVASLFVGYFCYFSVGLSCIWDIDEKGRATKCGFSYLKALSVSLGFCFISREQNGCVKFAVQALRSWQRKKPILLKMSGSGARSFHHSFARYIFFI